jgi:adenylosuccinate lyase
MPLESLSAVSSVDGRYRDASAALVPYFSEYALIRARVRVECEYLIALSKVRGLGMRRLKPAEEVLIRKCANVSLEDARLIKQIEKEGYGEIRPTNHDVKAVEYFLKDKLSETSLADVSEWIHFALTSEDVNSVAYGLLLRDSIEQVMLPGLSEVESKLESLSKTHAKTAMLARTHGQAASPTTFGKEMRVFLERLRRQVDFAKGRPILVKWGGATGNYNAHVVAAPEVDWQAFARRFIAALNVGHVVPIHLNEVTTQIESHDTYAELFDALRRINTILLDFSQDMWRYISDGWVTQKPKAGEVGSSTMPHKVNPIDFENAEGNFGVANTLFEHFSRKLPVSRLQRDLSDSTVERVFGTAFAHSLIAYRSLLKGLGKIEPNKHAMLAALQSHPEVLAEAIQTVLRKEGVHEAYEQLKELTRGKQVSMKDISAFIDGLTLDAKVKKRLKALRPENYIGLSADIAKGK